MGVVDDWVDEFGVDELVDEFEMFEVDEMNE